MRNGMLRRGRASWLPTISDQAPVPTRHKEFLTGERSKMLFALLLPLRRKTLVHVRDEIIGNRRSIVTM